MIDKQDLGRVQRLFDEWRKSSEGVFYEDQNQKNNDGYPELRLLDERQSIALLFGRVIVLPGANDTDSDERRDGRTGYGRQRSGDLLAAFKRRLRLLVVVRLRNGEDDKKIRPTIRRQHRRP